MYLAVGGWLPVAVLLPPVYSMCAPALTFLLLQTRTRATILYRRVFSAAVNGLALVSASAAFHALPATVTSDGREPLWLLAVAGCAVLWSALSQPLVLIAIRLSDPAFSIRQQLFNRTALANDACEIAGGLVISGAITGAGLILLVPALPVMAVLQRSFRRTQLDTRRDTETGLLYGDAWHAEAEVQLARAQRTGTPLAVGIIHIGLGDTPWYLARETALAAAAITIRSGLRPYDLTGQYRPQEIICLLPDITAGDAQQLGDRLRDSLTSHPLAAGPGQQPVDLTVTIGIAAHSNPAGTDLNGLLAPAEVALYYAQQPGQHPVCVTPSDIPTGHDIATARKKLGLQLCAARERAGLSQDALAHRIGCARSTVANAESGRPASLDFWRDADRGVRAGGKLLAERERIEQMMPAARSRAAKQGWARARHQD
jgi:diguanylate cyclase (GGDEF)-like protein